MEQREAIPTGSNMVIENEKHSPDERTEAASEQAETNQSSRKVKMETLQEFGRPQGSPMGTNIDFIMDIPLKLTVELGRTEMTIQDLLQLGQGSVIELGKIAGEPIEVLVHQKLIARGEVVRVNEKVGVRLTDIITPEERIEKVR